MFDTGNIHLARLWGIPILINLSWLLSLGFITVFLAIQFYPGVLEESKVFPGGQLVPWTLAIGGVSLLVLSVLLHELAHSLTARLLGLSVKSITLFMFGGFSRVIGEARSPSQDFMMAIVGPLTNTLIAGAFFLPSLLGGLSETNPVGVTLQWLGLMNIAFALLNLAPGFPMDGGRILRSVIWRCTGDFLEASRTVVVLGRILGWSLMLAGSLAFMGLLPAFLSAWSGAWLAVLGYYLNSSAGDAWVRAKAAVVLPRYKAAHLLNQRLETTGPATLVRDLVQCSQQPVYLYFVVESDRVIGIVTEKEVKALPAAQQLTVKTADVMTAPDKAAIAALDEDGVTLLQRMEEADTAHLPVISEGRVIGVVARSDLLSVVQRA